MKYKFSEPQRTAALNNGLIRCFYNEEIEKEIVETTNPETEETVTEEITNYLYEAVNITGPLEKGKVVDALIRTRYSQSDVEALLRHKIAGDEGADAEFDTFNAFAEACKVEAKRILGD